MQRANYFFIVIIFLLQACTRSDSPRNPPPTAPPALVLNEYDATFTSNTNGVFYTYSYHVKDTLYYSTGQKYEWSSLIRNASDTLYYVAGQKDAFTGINKGCVALVSGMDPAQQPNYDYYIGSYYKFSLFNDTAVGNVQFMVPTDGFPSVDSIPVDVAMLNFYGGLKSFYRGMAKAEVKVTPDKNFVQFGDNFSYADPLIPAQGTIDSSEVHMLVNRFSDNGIHPNDKVTKTMDANYFVRLYFHDGSFFTLYNGKFTNLFFQKAPL